MKTLADESLDVCMDGYVGWKDVLMDGSVGRVMND